MLFVTPEQFGAIGNGTTDDSNSFQQAINLITSQGGGTLKLQPKNYLINSAVGPSNANYVFIEGDGQGTTITLGGAGGTSPGLSFFNCTGCGISNLKISHQRPGWAIQTISCYRFFVKDVMIDAPTLGNKGSNGWGAIYADKFNYHVYENIGGELHDNGTVYAFYFAGSGSRAAGVNSDVIKIRDCVINVNPAGGTSYGIAWIGNSASLYVNDVDILNATFGLYSDVNAFGDIPLFISATGLSFEGGQCYRLNAISWCRLTDCYSYVHGPQGNASPVVYLGVHAYNEIQFINSRFSGSIADGIYIDGSQVKIIGCDIVGNSLSAPGTYSAISISPSSGGYIQVIGCSLGLQGDFGGGTQKYGVLVQSGTGPSRIIIEGNLYDGVTTDISNIVSSGPNEWVVANNV